MYRNSLNRVPCITGTVTLSIVMVIATMDMLITVMLILILPKNRLIVMETGIPMCTSPCC